MILWDNQRFVVEFTKYKIVSCLTNIVWTWLITCPGIHDTKHNLLKKMLYVLNVQILSYEFESCCRGKIFRVNTFSFFKELLLIFIIFLSLIDRNMKFWIMRGGCISFYLPLQNAQLHKWFWFNPEDLWKPLWSHPGFHTSCCVLIRMMMMKMTMKTLIKPPYFSFNAHLWPEEIFFSEKIPEFIASHVCFGFIMYVCIYVYICCCSYQIKVNESEENIAEHESFHDNILNMEKWLMIMRQKLESFRGSDGEWSINNRQHEAEVHLWAIYYS